MTDGWKQENVMAIPRGGGSSFYATHVVGDNATIPPATHERRRFDDYPALGMIVEKNTWRFTND